MVESEFDSASGTARFVLRPQRSATWRQNLWLVAAVAAMAVPIAVFWTAVGFWPILPLCGLELALLTLALYSVSHSLLAREVVVIDDNQITIEAGRRQIERRFELGRPWAQVLLQPPRNAWHASRLIIRSGGRAVECGRFLTNEEREQLWGELRQAVALPPPR
jgi:uncharacterized membrane protein